MPPQPARRRAAATAAAGPVPDDTPTPPPAATVAPERPARTRLFTVQLDDEAHTRYGQLLEQLRAHTGPVATRPDGNGRARGGYDVSRADLFRALLTVAEEDPQVMARAAEKVQQHYAATL